MTIVITAVSRDRPMPPSGADARARATLRPSGLLDECPKLAAYVARGEARPAYQRAFAAQWAINAGHPAGGTQ
jgi:glutathione S-transferase